MRSTLGCTSGNGDPSGRPPRISLLNQSEAAEVRDLPLKARRSKLSASQGVAARSSLPWHALLHKGLAPTVPLGIGSPYSLGVYRFPTCRSRLDRLRRRTYAKRAPATTGESCQA